MSVSEWEPAGTTDSTATGGAAVVTPWGDIAPLMRHGRFCARHLVLRPGFHIGPQSHFHRVGHWLVAAGSACVTRDGRATALSEGQSIDIPIGTVYRIENHGKVDLHLVEVQIGSYLGEDDLVPAH